MLKIVIFAPLLGALACLFLGDPPPPAPQGACGPDPTPDALAGAEFDC